ncbi:MAG: outer membrane protein, partial [Caulobacterales bacterium]
MAAVFAASGASAQVGWYGAVDLGYHWPEGVLGESSNFAANGQNYIWRFNQQDDWTGFARLGYQVTDHWRVELEGGYRPGDINSVRGGTNQAIVGLCSPNVVRTAAAPTCGSPDGKIESWTVLGNVIYDIGPDWVIDPFIGAGIGVNHINLTTDGQFSNVTGVITAPSGANPAIQNLHIDDSDTVFAWQLIGGASWRATDRLKVDATYRFLSGSDGRFTSVGTNALQPGTFRGKYRDSSVTLGLRYSFA